MQLARKSTQLPKCLLILKFPIWIFRGGWQQPFTRLCFHKGPTVRFSLVRRHRRHPFAKKRFRVGHVDKRFFLLCLQLPSLFQLQLQLLFPWLILLQVVDKSYATFSRQQEAAVRRPEIDRLKHTCVLCRKGGMNTRRAIVTIERIDPVYKLSEKCNNKRMKYQLEHLHEKKHFVLFSK